MVPADHDLPGIITAITPQKKNKSRYSIFVDETFLIGVADETLLKRDLREGNTIDAGLYRSLQRDEGRQAIKSYLLKLLARRDHARRELINKAGRKDFAKETIIDVVDELERKGYINNASFAEKFARDKQHLNDWGPYKIKAHLQKKGVSKSVSKKAIQKAFKAVNIEALFQSLIKKRRRHFRREENALKRKKKVVAYLQRKGYRSGDIYRHIDQLMQQLET